MKQFLFILVFALFSTAALCQQSNSKVSLIGDNGNEYETLMVECPSLLLQVANNSMDEAYKAWTSMLAEMESQASDQGLDLKGVKIWINLFWEADGSIKNIVYYPKPNSKNMDFDQLTTYLNDFSNTYHLPIDHNACFSHYGSASFPVFTKLAIPNEK